MTSKAEIVRRFEANGVSIAEWARTNNYKYRTVLAVLSGELKCKRGVSHRIAVAIGIKAQPQSLGE